MPSYRMDVAENRRATCFGSKPCKGTRFEKGDFRIGPWLEFNETGSYKYRHLECLTPKTIANLKKEYHAPSEIDGWDEVPKAMQDKLKLYWELGHVPEEDIRESAKKHTPPPEVENGGEVAVTEEKPSKKASKSKTKAAKVKAEAGAEDAQSIDRKSKKPVAEAKAEAEQPPTSRKRKAPAGKVKVEESKDAEDAQNGEHADHAEEAESATPDEEDVKPKKQRKSRVEKEGNGDAPPPRRSGRAKVEKAPIIERSESSSSREEEDVEEVKVKSKNGKGKVITQKPTSVVERSGEEEEELKPKVGDVSGKRKGKATAKETKIVEQDIKPDTEADVKEETQDVKPGSKKRKVPANGRKVKTETT